MIIKKKKSKTKIIKIMLLLLPIPQWDRKLKKVQANKKTREIK